ncbi:T9SS type A sorting domain-containing protein [Ekhidna sp.]
MLGSASAQLSTQGYSAYVAGGISSGSNFSTEISTGYISEIVKGDGYTILPGLAAANLETSIVSVRAINSSNQVISDDFVGYLLKIRQSGNYDTLDIPTSNSGDFSFASVFHGDYLVVVDSDPEKFVATYFGDTFSWDEADVLKLDSDTTTQIVMTNIPPVLDENDGEGLVKGTVEEDFEDEEGRIAARRRAKGRKCGLKQRRRGGRTEQDEFTLIAYGETNNDGEFEYGFLPQGTYRFFVEYPGIPIDESSFVEFNVGEAGVSDNQFTLAALVTEEGITIELILGLTSEFFTNFNIYPNPTVNKVNISYDKILSDKISMELIDMNGNMLLKRDLKKENQSIMELDLAEYSSGQYLLKFFDHQNNKTAMTFRVIKR